MEPTTPRYCSSGAAIGPRGTARGIDDDSSAARGAAVDGHDDVDKADANDDGEQLRCRLLSSELLRAELRDSVICDRFLKNRAPFSFGSRRYDVIGFRVDHSRSSSNSSFMVSFVRYRANREQRRATIAARVRQQQLRRLSHRRRQRSHFTVHYRTLDCALSHS